MLNLAERIARLRTALYQLHRRPRILLYHNVGPVRPGTPLSLTISPKQFERQMQWLAKRGYAVITPSDWLRRFREGVDMPKKPVLLTFDDAYSDTAQYALPVLERYGFGAVIFVVTGRLGATNTWDEANGCGTLRLMTAEQIRQWATRGIEFGAHSRTHSNLTTLSPSELEAEVVGSKNDLETLLGSPIVSFAYPFGEHSGAVRDLVRSHFGLGFGTDEGINLPGCDLSLLRRAYVGPNDSLMEFGLAVRSGGLKKIREWRVRYAVRSRLRRILRSLRPTAGSQ